MEGDERGERPGLRLSGRQQAAVAVALTIVAAAIILTAVGGIGWLVARFVGRFSHVFLPLAVGGIAALVFRPYYSLLRQKLRLPAPVAVGVVFASILLPLVAFSWFFGAIAVHQLADMLTRFPEWRAELEADLRERWPQVQQFLENNPWGQRIKTMVEGQSGEWVGQLQDFGTRALTAGAGILSLFGTLAAWAVLPVYFAFFLIVEPKRKVTLEEWLPFLKPETRDDAVYLIREFVNIIVAFFRGQLIVAFLQGLLFAIGFSVVGLRYGFVLGLLLGFLNIIPYLGNIIGLGIGIPLAWFQADGGPVTLGLVLLVFVIVQLIEGYLLTPKIMGDRTGLHPMVIIVAIFFWGSALQGILGMILAIPLTAFLVVFWRLAREKYIGELV
jgi:predicted PurR-regulated permease PerM